MQCAKCDTINEAKQLIQETVKSIENTLELIRSRSWVFDCTNMKASEKDDNMEC